MKNNYDLTVGDKIKHTESCFVGGVVCYRTRHGTLLAKNGDKVLVSLADFGSIVEEELRLEDIELDAE